MSDKTRPSPLAPDAAKPKPKPPIQKPRHAAKEIAKACEGSNGVVAVVAKKLSVSRDTVDRAAAKYPEVRAALNEARETAIDVIEGTVFARAISGDMRAAVFVLESKGRKRGWGKEPETSATEALALALSQVLGAGAREDGQARAAEWRANLSNEGG